MESRAKLFGHSIHAMLITFPVGLFVTAIVFDLRLHGVGNVIVVVLFLASWWLRRGSPDQPPVVALIFSFVGIALAACTAWLGGELVERLGVGVDDGANVNAPSSLSGPVRRDSTSGRA